MDIQKKSFYRILSGSLLIAGTTVGAGMLGIPLLTAQAGYYPALVITLLVWLFMLCTGQLFLEVTLWMPDGSNILSMARKFLGPKGELSAGLTFLFYYYCLMVAYFSAGAPILTSFLGEAFSGWPGYLIYGLLFGSIVGLGLKWVDRVNYVLVAGMVITYIALVGGGLSEIAYERLNHQSWPLMLFAAPILFSSFGYHNIIPSLSTYLKRDGSSLRKALLWGTIIPLLFYLVWQWLLIGVLSQDQLNLVLTQGRPVTEAFQGMIDKDWVGLMGRSFGFFAIVTSMLGVSFSLVDFLGDAFKIKNRTGKRRALLCLVTFAPPFIFTLGDPQAFIHAIGIAGGFGGAFLNGILPVLLVWVGRYQMNMRSEYQLPGKRLTLCVLLVFAVFVIHLEAYNLLTNGI